MKRFIRFLKTPIAALAMLLAFIGFGVLFQRTVSLARRKS